MSTINPIYFETRFRSPTGIELPAEWPSSFAIISAYATTGQVWTDEQNQAADDELRHEFASRNVWHQRIIGYSPSTGHEEPSWIAGIGWGKACNVGFVCKQDAIYYVSDDVLTVSHCDHRREPVMVGKFSERLDA